MRTLRLMQSVEHGTHRVDIDLRSFGAHHTANALFDWEMNPQEQEDVRWYLEDYLQYPIEPAPTIAARIEQRLAAQGRELFTKVFKANSDTIRLWDTVSPHLPETRVEVATTVEDATAIPWELLRDPATDTVLAMRARAFVRTQLQTAQAARSPKTAPKIRLLLVICRPGGGVDVPFRSVASHLIRLSRAAREVLHLEVLRPPSFDQLKRVLQAARQRGEPYHIVHFDGHGTYTDLGVRPGHHGYLLFENADIPGNAEYVDGRSLGELLAGAEVPVLVLNACRSAYADLVTEPQAADRDTDQRVRAYGSLAQEVMDAGVSGVVAMRYNIYVVTAAKFVAKLYQALSDGQDLGGAVTAGRAQLAKQPNREIAFAPRPLQDWTVPVVYEAAPQALLAEPAARAGLAITLDQAEGAAERAAFDPALPFAPDAGFYGRDETLLALDRAFDTRQIVLLHGWAGGGKTSTAVEFARWYQLTGGLARGEVLFTAFTQHTTHTTLVRVVDQVGRAFRQRLEGEGVHWLKLSDAKRREVALKKLAEVPVLWIWDNVEPVGGFPAGTPSKWSASEQRELVKFLRDLRGTKAKVLLTSRRDEQGWLGDLPARIMLPPMPMAERVELARAIATHAKHGGQLTDVDDWRPLLEFTQGNPLTVTVLVGQALHDGLQTRTQIETFITDLRAGVASISDDIAQDRDKSLAASLNYGFDHAFTDHQRHLLALLHLFEGAVNVAVLRAMGDPEFVGAPLAELRDLGEYEGIALLDRAAEIGLLTPRGGGYYAIHPALPLFFQRLFAQYYGPSGQQKAMQAIQAYVDAMGSLADYYQQEYVMGRGAVIGVIAAEEANFLHALQLARAHGRWDPATSAMQGLHTLYQHMGRVAEWKRLVDELAKDLVDPATNAPLPGHEDEWDLVTHYRAQIAYNDGDWAAAKRLEQVRMTWHKERARAALTVPAEALDSDQHSRLRSLAVSLEMLGVLLREEMQASCVTHFQDAIKLYQRIGDQQAEANIALNLGHAYLRLPSLYDPDEAERWYRRSLELRHEEDRLGRARSVGMLGIIAYARFQEAYRNRAHVGHDELVRHWRAAEDKYERALHLLPEDAINELAVAHTQLGMLYSYSPNKVEEALRHCQQAIDHHEEAMNLQGAGGSRYQAAIVLANAGRLEDALQYAQAALNDFERVGVAAQEGIESTQTLIAEINERQEASHD